jgi:hypothetical protein
MVKIVALHQIYHNYDGIFETTPEIDQKTGDYRVRAVATILAAGGVHDVPDALASELVESSAARYLSAQECQLQALADGALMLERRPMADPADMWG